MRCMTRQALRDLLYSGERAAQWDGKPLGCQTANTGNALEGMASRITIRLPVGGGLSATEENWEKPFFVAHQIFLCQV